MRLRKLREKDAEGMLEWMHDKEVNKYFYTDFSKFDEKKVLDFIETSFTDSNRHYACVNDQDEYLGTISLKNINYNARNAEYAISFRRGIHGTGAANFATSEILNIAFIELKLERVYLNVIKCNERANKFYVKSGFTLEGIFRKHLKVGEQLEDLVWYSMLKEEFNRNGEKPI